MSWYKATLIALVCAVLLQVGVLGFLWVRASQATLALQATPPSFASFDPETSLTMFVVWSQDQLEDAQFQGALSAFTARVEAELTRYAAETGVTIIREGAVLAGARAPDVTTAIMERVLADAAF